MSASAAAARRARCGPGWWHGTHSPPGSPDVRGRGMVQELFFDSVFAEAGDGGQPAGDGGAGTSSGFQLPGEAFDVGAVDGEQGQGTGAAPAGELAQVQCIGVAGQATVPGQEPGEGEPFGVGEGRLDGSQGSGWGGSGHRAPPGRAETRRLGQRRVSAIKRNPKLNFSSRSLHVTDRRYLERGQPPEQRSSPPKLCGRPVSRCFTYVHSDHPDLRGPIGALPLVEHWFPLAVSESLLSRAHRAALCRFRRRGRPLGPGRAVRAWPGRGRCGF